MKFLSNWIEKIKPNFEKGAKFEKWKPIFESFETFLFVLPKNTKLGSHIRDNVDLKRIMSIVIIALIPTALFGMWNIGNLHYQSIGDQVMAGSILSSFVYGFLKMLPMFIVSYICGLGVEFIFVFIKQKEIDEGMLVTAFLIPLICPVTVPLWQLAIATIFATVIGKEAFGGTGMNFMNPALLARAFLFFAYPSKMSGSVWIAENGKMDGLTGASPLGDMDNKIFDNIPSLWDSFIGTHAGSIGETSILMILIGMAILLWTGVVNWRIIVSALLGGFLFSLLFSATGQINGFNEVYHGDVFTCTIHQLMLGGFMFGIVFMATDPVTSAQTQTGRWIYGFMVGALSMSVRVLNSAYPEGVMLAILLMNTLAPLIDYYVVEANIKRRLKRATIKIKSYAI